MPNSLLNPLGKSKISSQRTLYRIVVFAEANDDRCHNVFSSDSGSEKGFVKEHRAAADFPLSAITINVTDPCCFLPAFSFAKSYNHLMKRLIFHIDVNSAFLSWESTRCVKNGKAELRLIPSGKCNRAVAISAALYLFDNLLTVLRGKPLDFLGR